MKNKFVKLLGLFSATVVLNTSCTKNFDEINTDPTAYNPSNFEPNYLLTTSQLAYTGSFDFSYETWRGNLIYSSTMMQQLSTVIGYWAGDKYILNADYTAAYWVVAYPEQVKPVTDLVELTRNKPQYKNLHQIGRIMRAMILQRISDLYGDVPYSTAGLGYYSGTYFPVYDKQQDIYTDIIKEYEEAAIALDPAADKPDGDAFYRGKTDQIEKWKKLAYSLMLRAGMRLSKVDPAKAQATVAKAIGKTMQSNDDNAYLVHDEAGGRPTVNRNFQVLQGQPEGDYVKWSKKLIDFMKDNNDPRLGIIAQVNNGDRTPANQKGMPNGYDLSGVAGRDISSAPGYTTMAAYSKPSSLLNKLNAPTFVFTYGESELLLADAAARLTGIPGIGAAATYYNNGVKAAITYMAPYDAAAAISATAADNYLIAHPYVPASGLEMINTQYYALTATMFDFYEGWSNWRRTNFPNLTPVVYPGNVTNGTVPRRFPYPLSEANTNPTNYKAAHDAVPGGDLLIGRVWWDKQ
ncbi:MAG: SusD/RagB family nutrient-binding outer membrane lipoprotein [Chitinophagaceae bacterium]|nr:SusD/RagB family nutrient-binding outer membrane lipoprotein [Chitinophagaceae bacterium]